MKTFIEITMENVQRTVRIGTTTTAIDYDIVFSDLNLTVEDSTAMREEIKKLGWKRFVPFQKGRVPKIEKKILQNISGLFRFRRFTAIMGASGAGKTSLLTQIAGQLPKDTKTSGKLFIKGQSLDYDAIKNLSGFVFQDDVILATMTVEEALKMSAKLRLPPEINKSERVQKMIESVSLEKAKKTQIGQPGGKKGISGGERKRTSKHKPIMLVVTLFRHCHGINNRTDHFILR